MDRRQLLATILHDPDDLGARALYGDLLELDGDPRGRFINLQLAGALREAEQLRREHESIWWPAAQLFSVRSYRNGFLEDITLCKSPRPERLEMALKHPEVRAIRSIRSHSDVPYFALWGLTRACLPLRELEVRLPDILVHLVALPEARVEHLHLFHLPKRKVVRRLRAWVPVLKRITFRGRPSDRPKLAEELELSGLSSLVELCASD